MNIGENTIASQDISDSNILINNSSKVTDEANVPTEDFQSTEVALGDHDSRLSVNSDSTSSNSTSEEEDADAKPLVPPKESKSGSSFLSPIRSVLRSRRHFPFAKTLQKKRDSASAEKLHGTLIPMSVGNSSQHSSQEAEHSPYKRLYSKICWPEDAVDFGSTLEARNRIWMGTLAIMNFFAKVLLWCTAFATFVAVVWYSIELKNNGTDPHLIAWFQAGAFVLLGFPISMYGIFQHLSNYYQPSIQCYVVRILWMVPVYSIESWLCLRFREYAIYIETARDCYESFVLYSFMQYLEQILGGEQELVLMLKNKSPTRGMHIPPMNWFISPWLMGQPINVTNVEIQTAGNKKKRKKLIQWTSPFYIKCKFGVLQYVILKLFTAIATMILALKQVYKEGDFSLNGGYFYICIITNTSQCWALYCLIFFYNATKNELSPIRPVGKFLSVKCIVFFTWWQSLFIGILDHMNFLPSYYEWSAEEVAKSLQAYLICIEMFAAALVHFFVFPHTDYLNGRMGIVMGANIQAHQKHHRLGRRLHRKKIKDNNESYADVEMDLIPSMTEWDEESTIYSEQDDNHSHSRASTSKTIKPAQIKEGEVKNNDDSHSRATEPSIAEKAERTNFVKAFLDSSVPTDVMDNTLGIVKGEFNVEKKTLLHHATTSDDYDLFSANSKRRQRLLASQNSSKDKGTQKKTNDNEAKNTDKSHIKSKMSLNEFL